MNRDKRSGRPPQTDRRTFLKQFAATSALAGMAAGPVLGEERTEGRVSASEKRQVPLGEALASYAMTLRYEDLPEEVVRIAKRSILDTFGCALGGYSAGPSQIAIRLASGVTAKQAATVLCSGIKSSPDLAVFANGVMIRYLDFNDGFVSFKRGAGHPSDTIAALLGAAELAGSSGRDLITATVLSYEVFCKIMDVFDNQAIGIDHSTMTGFAAVIGASRLLGLSEQQIVQAIGMTVGGNTALHQGRAGTLSNWKSYAAADACRKAIFAAQLAQSGMTGPGNIFEGRQGFFNTIGGKPVEPVQLGEPYGIRRAFTKRFPLGQFSQTVAQAAVEARRFFRDPADIAEVNIHVSRTAIKIMADSPDKWRPQTHETADHSLPYAAGVALMYGTIQVEHYEDPYLHSPALLDLVSRIKCLPSEEADRNEREFNLCELEVVLKSGERHTVRVEYHRGHWKNPMSDAEMEEKFRSLAGKQLSADRINNLLEQLWTLERLPTADALVAATLI